MRYSVWNPGARAYDYYEAPGLAGTHADAPPRAAAAAELGATPDQAAWPLPVTAIKVGVGDVPQGRIASIGNDAGGVFKIDLPRSLAYAAAGYLLWRVLR